MTFVRGGWAATLRTITIELESNLREASRHALFHARVATNQASASRRTLQYPAEILNLMDLIAGYWRSNHSLLVKPLAHVTSLRASGIRRAHTHDERDIR